MSTCWKQVEQIFLDASDRDPSERDAFLKEACGSDSELLQEVQQLLECDDEGVMRLFGKAIEEVASSVGAEQVEPQGTRIGRYRIVRKLGQGGMGAVFLAVRDDDQYDKQVALKVIRFGMDAPWMVERFRHERQILASLEHPNIARLLDGGSTDDRGSCSIVEEAR